MSTARPIVTTGSIAIDRIMSFVGSYGDHLHPEKLSRVSVSIFLDRLVDSYGGVAANIAYTLASLGEEAFLVGSVGTDAITYLERLAKHGVNITHVHESTLPTASFNVITDREQNQIGGFYPGAMFDSETLTLEPWYDKNPVVVLSPHDPHAMRRQVQECLEHHLSICYDIGQQVSNAPAEDLLEGVRAAEILILNEYELSVLSKKIGQSTEVIMAQTPIVIVTRGPLGSSISGAHVQQPFDVGVAEPEAVIDPTGTGDAYRAGFIYGYAHDLPLKACAQLGATCASFAIETLGTQTHTCTKQDILERYELSFGAKLPVTK
ncbi:MAG: carbohydrate kinase family protein [Candidatus Saccharimonadales bacterium]